MFTYQVRPRILKFDPGTQITVPALAEVTFEFAPAQAFGAEPGRGRTAVRSVEAVSTFNVRTGQYVVESKMPLAPLAVTIDQEDLRISVAGKKVTLAKTVRSQKELSDLIEAVYYLLPLLLSVGFADPPVIEDVQGVVSEKPFGWNLEQWRLDLLTTTQDKQTQLVKDAWRRFQIIVGSGNRRLVAALHYFHVAVRLARVSASPGEFLAEALLNYCKVLEVLFSASTKTIRLHLEQLGYSHDDIERDYVPAMILRSKIDVAHVSLALFTPQQLATLHRYADRAEGAFRSLLSRVLERLDAGSLDLPEYELHAADSEATAIIERMALALAKLGNRP
jgi:hypothetical protein